MRTTLELDERLLGEAERIAGDTSPSKVVNKALEEYIRQDRVRRLLASLGNRDLELDDWYEYRHQERTWMVIVDTSVLIQAYRLPNSPEKAELARLVNIGRAASVGLVLTEILRGARSQTEYDEVTEELRALQYLESSEETWLLAGKLLLDLRLRGETIPLQDAIIAAYAMESGHQVYSLDQHFTRIPGLQLHEVGS